MSIEENLVAYLATDSTLTTLCGQRIYPDIAPESAVYPLVIYEITAGEVDNNMDGGGDYERTDIRMTIYSRRDTNGKKTVISIRDRLKYLLNGYKRFSPASGQLPIQGIFYQPSFSGYIPETKLYFQQLDISIHFTNT